MSNINILLNSINAVIEEEEDLATIPPSIRIPVSRNYNIPDFSCEADKAEGSISIRSSSTERTTAHRSLKPFEKKIEKLSHFIHDFTFFNYSTETDMELRLSSISLPGHDDKYTPDLIHEHGDRVFIIEFQTLYEASDESLKRHFDGKIASYRDSVERRQEVYKDKKIYLFVLVISPDGAWTNITSIPEDEVNILAFRLKCAKNLVRDLQNIDVDVGQTRTELLMRQREAKLSFQALDIQDIKYNTFFSEELFASENRFVDTEHVLDLVSRCLKRAKKTLIKESHLNINEPSYDEALQQNGLECEEELLKFISTLKNRETNKSFKMKSVINFPFFVPVSSEKLGSNLIDSEFYNWNIYRDLESGNDDVVTRLWVEAHEALRAGRVMRAEESDEMSDDLYVTIVDQFDGSLADDDLESVRKDHRKNFKRFRATNLSASDRISLALDGIQAKEVKDNYEKKVKEMESKQFLNYDTDLSDIESMFESKRWMWFAENSYMENMSFFKSKILIKRAYDIHGNNLSDNILESVGSALSSRLGQWCSSISDIGQELTISLRQNCGRDQFVLKKLRHYEVYLLIKPTKSSSHIFVSLCIQSYVSDMAPKECMSVFKKFRRIGDFIISDFVSFKEHKLKNLLECESSFISILFHSMEQFRVPCVEGDVKEANRGDDWSVGKSKAWKLSLFTLLMLLHDKTAAEEVMTLSRFVCMEGFVSFPRVPRPYKMLEKLNVRPRSRLELFIMKRLLKTMLMISCQPFIVKKDEVTDEDLLALGMTNEPYFSGLFDPVLHERLDSPDVLLNYFYIGYFKNKNESPEANSNLQLLKKIIEWEDKTPKEGSRLGLHDFKDGEEVQPLEFDRSLLDTVCLHATKTLRSKMGTNWRELLEDKILWAISESDLEDLATLKASSNFGPNMLYASDVKNYHRSKLIESVPKMNVDGIKLSTIMGQCLTKLEETESLYIDIFKKAQHGGTREIYVMSPESRVVQLVIEKISRVICKEFDSETMTHPKHKFSLQKDHYKNCASAFKNEEFATLATSDDAAKWNQGHFVTKFFIMLRHFTPRYMHKFLWRALKLWTKKRIMIPEPVLKLIERNVPPELSIDFYNDLLAGHKGTRLVDWKSAGTSYIETRSGMMQGILHYTSSLYHTVYLEWLKHLMVKDMQRGLSIDMEKTVVCTNMQSSDDSSMLLSFPAHTPYEKVKGSIMSAILFEAKHEIGKFLGIYKSVKCTQNTMNVMEFNSEFFFCFNLFRPVIRWVAAALTLSENESLAARQEEMSNNLTAVLEGGGSILTTSFIQVAQAMLFYRTFGLSTSSQFSCYSSSLIGFPDPSLGFFLMDNPIMTGVSGFKYNLYMLMKGSIVYKKYFHLLKNGDSNMVNDVYDDDLKDLTIIEPTSTGAVLQSTTITFGNRKKWKKLLERAELPNDWVSQVDQCKGELLFRRAVNRDEILTKISAKAHSPGVCQSLSRGNDVTRIIASSVYILSERVLRIGSQWIGKSDERQYKCTLTKLLNQDSMKFDRMEVYFNEETMKFLFPHLDSYRSLEATCSKFNYQGLVRRSGQRKKVKTEIEVIEVTSSNVIPLEDLCRYKWYNIGDLPFATRVINQDWDRFSLAIPWLDTDPEKTLEKSPFSNYVQLSNFISKQTLKGRRVHLSASPVVSRQGSSNISSLIMNDLFPGYSPIRANTGVEDSSILLRKSMMHSLAMLTTLEDGYSVTPIRSILEDSDEILTRGSNTRADKLAEIQIITKDLKRKLNKRENMSLREEARALSSEKEDYFDIMMSSYSRGRSTLGIFTLRQNFSKDLRAYVGPAIWRGSIEGVIVEIAMHSNFDNSGRNFMLYMRISNRKRLFDIIGELRSLMADLRLDNTSMGKENDWFDRALASMKLEHKTRYDSSTIGLMNLRPGLKARNVAALIEEQSLTFTLQPGHIKYLRTVVENGMIKVIAILGNSFFDKNNTKSEDPKREQKISELDSSIRIANNKLRNTMRQRGPSREVYRIRSLINRLEQSKEKLLEEYSDLFRMSIVSFRPRASDIDLGLAEDMRDLYKSGCRDPYGLSLSVIQLSLIIDYILYKRSNSNLVSVIAELEQKTVSDDEFVDFKIRFLKERLKDGFRSAGFSVGTAISKEEATLREVEQWSQEELNQYLFGIGDVACLDSTLHFPTMEHDIFQDEEVYNLPMPGSDFFMSISELIDTQIADSTPLELKIPIVKVIGHPLADHTVYDYINKFGRDEMKRLFNDREVRRQYKQELCKLARYLGIEGVKETDSPIRVSHIFEESETDDII